MSIIAIFISITFSFVSYSTVYELVHSLDFEILYPQPKLHQKVFADVYHCKSFFFPSFDLASPRPKHFKHSVVFPKRFQEHHYCTASLAQYSSISEKEVKQEETRIPWKKYFTAERNSFIKKKIFLGEKFESIDNRNTALVQPVLHHVRRSSNIVWVMSNISFQSTVVMATCFSRKQLSPLQAHTQMSCHGNKQASKRLSNIWCELHARTIMAITIGQLPKWR